MLSPPVGQLQTFAECFYLVTTPGFTATLSVSKPVPATVMSHISTPPVISTPTMTSVFFLLKYLSFLSYLTQVDRALNGFESTAEWADLIASLTRLNNI